MDDLKYNNIKKFVDQTSNLKLRFPIIIKGSFVLKYLNLISRDINDLDLIIYNNGLNTSFYNKINRILNNDFTILKNKVSANHCFISHEIEFDKKKIIIEVMLKQKIPLKFCTKYKNQIFIIKTSWLFYTKFIQIVQLIIFKDERKIKLGNSIKDLKAIIKKYNYNFDYLKNNYNEALNFLIFFNIFFSFFSSDKITYYSLFKTNEFLPTLKKYCKDKEIIYMYENAYKIIDFENERIIKIGNYIINNKQKLMNLLFSEKMNEEYSFKTQINYKTNNLTQEKEEVEFNKNILYFKNVETIYKFIKTVINESKDDFSCIDNIHLEYIVFKKWKQNKISFSGKITTINKYFYRNISTYKGEGIKIWIPLGYSKAYKKYMLSIENLLLLFILILKHKNILKSVFKE